MVAAAGQDNDRLLGILHDAAIPFVVIGGVAAVAHGSSLTTRDLDVVMPMELSPRSR